MAKRPSIKSPCVADRYHRPTERIAEITFPNGSGCLLQLIVLDSGENVIRVYRTDPGIVVRAGAASARKLETESA